MGTCIGLEDVKSSVPAPRRRDRKDGVEGRGLGVPPNDLTVLCLGIVARLAVRNSAMDGTGNFGLTIDGSEGEGVMSVTRE